MQTHLPLPFADGTYQFRLTVPGIAEVQRKTGVAFGLMLPLLTQGVYVDQDGNIAQGDPTATGAWTPELVYEVLRQGLIGGKSGLVDGEPVEVTALVANALIEAYVLPTPIYAHWITAVNVVRAFMVGFVPPVPQPAAAEEKRKPRKRSTTPRT